MTSFSLDPYQIGHENEEAIASGAFWFYRKLGFRSTDPQLRALTAREEARLAADPAYRTPSSVLRRLAATSPSVLFAGWLGSSAEMQRESGRPRRCESLGPSALLRDDGLQTNAVSSRTWLPCST